VTVKGEKISKERDPDTGRDIVKEVEFDVMINNGVSAVASKDYGGEGFAPKAEYCYYALGQEDTGFLIVSVPSSSGVRK
jgi:hypothetical protein